MLTLINCLQWLGFCGSVLRQILLAKARVSAIRLSFFVDMIWIVWAFSVQAWALLALNVLYVFLDARILYCWRRDNDARTD